MRPIRPLPALLLLLLLLLLASEGLRAAPEGEVPASTARGRAYQDFPPGERLTYSAKVWKGLGFIGMSVGTAVFEIKEDQDEGLDTLRFSAEASGGGLGYQLRSRIISQFDPATGRPLRYHYRQDGSEQREKAIVFDAAGASFLQLKHCFDGACGDATHVVEVRRPTGWFWQFETAREHCSDNACARPEHLRWFTRSRHDLEGELYDMLSAIYMARRMDLEVGGAGRTIRVVNDKSVWDVRVRAVRQGRVDVPAGRYDGLLLDLDPSSVTGVSSRNFEGLFGIKGAIQIWIDRATKTPLRISGTVPFGIDINVEVALLQREDLLAGPR
ncbi:MAG: DUF3108 domain-containing protein [Planctomycetes bacterium]|nr:DUF3108 domain-containing protein [Planctomycetota bacterium]